jgi:hypothetical protein
VCAAAASAADASRCCLQRHHLLRVPLAQVIAAGCLAVMCMRSRNRNGGQQFHPAMASGVV